MSVNTETARRLAALFDTMTAQDGSKRVYIKADQDSPDGAVVHDMVYAADQAGLHNDDAYEMVQDALHQIADTEPDEISETDRDGLIEVYTAPLMQWLARNHSLADEMKDEFGQWPETLDEIARYTQDYAYGIVLGAIESNWPEDTDDEETES